MKNIANLSGVPLVEETNHGLGSSLLVTDNPTNANNDREINYLDPNNMKLGTVNNNIYFGKDAQDRDAIILTTTNATVGNTDNYLNIIDNIKIHSNSSSISLETYQTLIKSKDNDSASLNSQIEVASNMELWSSNNINIISENLNGNINLQAPNLNFQGNIVAKNPTNDSNPSVYSNISTENGSIGNTYIFVGSVSHTYNTNYIVINQLTCLNSGKYITNKNDIITIVNYGTNIQQITIDKSKIDQYFTNTGLYWIQSNLWNCMEILLEWGSPIDQSQTIHRLISSNGAGNMTFEYSAADFPSFSDGRIKLSFHKTAY